jgi:hypothetical protein
VAYTDRLSAIGAPEDVALMLTMLSSANGPGTISGSTSHPGLLTVTWAVFEPPTNVASPPQIVNVKVAGVLVTYTMFCAGKLYPTSTAWTSWGSSPVYHEL